GALRRYRARKRGLVAGSVRACPSPDPRAPRRDPGAARAPGARPRRGEGRVMESRTVDLASGNGHAADGLDPNRWRALAVLGIAYLMVVLDVAIVNVALPSIQSSLH